MSLSAKAARPDGLRRRIAVALLGAFLATALVFMLKAATRGHDWPGWDEAWVLIAFPLGIPAAVAVGLRSVSRQVAIATGAVWCWGALLFLLWMARG